MKLILASQSPRRREILGRFFRDFDVTPSQISEESNVQDSIEHVIEVARKKAWDVYKEHDGTVIGADTVVTLDDKILGKPKSPEEAKQMLELLSGKAHELTSFLS